MGGLHTHGLPNNEKLQRETLFTIWHVQCETTDWISFLPPAIFRTLSTVSSLSQPISSSGANDTDPTGLLLNPVNIMLSMEKMLRKPNRKLYVTLASFWWPCLFPAMSPTGLVSWRTLLLKHLSTLNFLPYFTVTRLETLAILAPHHPAILTLSIPVTSYRTSDNKFCMWHLERFLRSLLFIPTGMMAKWVCFSHCHLRICTEKLSYLLFRGRKALRAVQHECSFKMPNYIQDNGNRTLKMKRLKFLMVGSSFLI